MARDTQRRLAEALDAWRQARDFRAAGRTTRAGLAYQRGINAFLLYRNVSRREEEERNVLPRTDHTPVLYALGAIGREGVPAIEAARSRRFAMAHARTALAAAHLADPGGGVPEAVGPLLSGPFPVLPRLDPADEEPVPADERIAGAASSRLLMARLMVTYPRVLTHERDRWPVAPDEPMPFIRERRRFRSAVLPGCQGLDRHAEIRRLAADGVRLYTKLARAIPRYQVALDRATDEQRAIRRGLEQG
ncbi:hypothetical protein [Streptomyces sp. NBRC 109706]|uniref:hypothetical protein n=1 Tax=Streptomyces sp. NBRC 109706 TaxID=1550035 RepID=UPI0007806265|nr:hypothetical protein [Streptomyces sp. NBRC 109706]